MFKGFNLRITQDKLDYIFDHHNNNYNYYYDPLAEKFEEKLNEIIDTEDVLDEQKIEKDWFPSVNADVFLSHSHADKKLADRLAMYLKTTFKLNCFIDSNVWGCSEKLLKKIDNKYCHFRNLDSYDYDLRNIFTAHIHIILSMALAKMIDKTECVIFLNTPHSVKFEDIKENNVITQSPWIYNELTLTSLIRSNIPSRLESESIVLEEALEKRDLQMNYKLYLGHLIPLNECDLLKWENRYEGMNEKNNSDYALDTLYSCKKIIKEA